MRITVTTDVAGTNAFTVEVGAEMEMEVFLGLCQFDVPSFVGVELSQFTISHNSRAIKMDAENLKKTFKDLGIKNEDVLLVNTVPFIANARSDATVQSIPSSEIGTSASTSDLIASLVSGIKVPNSVASNSHSIKLRSGEIAQLRTLFTSLQSSAERRDLMRSVTPHLVDAAENRSFESFCQAFVENRARMLIRQRAMLDPLNPEGQQLIAEQIERENIEFSHKFALEHMPESYIPVTMLYIKMKINGMETKAFVDSGAQVSILSERITKRCNLMRLVDRRFQGMVHGVGGTQHLIGKIHTCPIQIESNFFPCNFDVLADRDIDVLFGLDILKRHRCVIDLGSNCLRFGDTTQTPFLGDSEIPAQRLDHFNSRTDSSENAAAAVDSEKLASLLAMGFEESAARTMLLQCANDVETAAANLLAQGPQ